MASKSDIPSGETVIGQEGEVENPLGATRALDVEVEQASELQGEVGVALEVVVAPAVDVEGEQISEVLGAVVDTVVATEVKTPSSGTDEGQGRSLSESSASAESEEPSSITPPEVTIFFLFTCLFFLYLVPSF